MALLRLKSYTNQKDGQEVTIDLDKVCYVYPPKGQYFSVIMTSGNEVVISISEINEKKFIRKWKGEEE